MKKLFSSGLATATYFLFTTSVYAQTTIDICPLQKPGQAGQFNPLCALTGNKAGGIVGTVVTLLLIIAVVIAILFLIYGGIKWILSGGDKSAVEAARNHIIAAVVGLVIAFISYFILTVVIEFFLPGFSISKITLPTLQ